MISGITGQLYCPNGHSHRSMITKKIIIDQPISPDEGYMTFQKARVLSSQDIKMLST